MLLSQIEYDILYPIYRGNHPKLDKPECHDAIEFLLSNHLLDCIEIKDDAEANIDIQYRITTLGRRAYEECENYLTDEKRKNATLYTAKKANKIAIAAISVSALSFLVAFASLLVSFLK